jgi:hypothetical protein
MKPLRSIPQRTFQVPNRSRQPVVVAMRATFPAGVSSHSMKPGVCSLMSPPPAEVGGPQQGGLSVPSPAGRVQAPGGSDGTVLRIPVMANGLRSDGFMGVSLPAGIAWESAGQSFAQLQLQEHASPLALPKASRPSRRERRAMTREPAASSQPMPVRA